MKNIEKMISDIMAEYTYTRHMTGLDKPDPRVIQAMREVPRDHFVPEDMKRFAFDNGPLPIGYNQTISQPYIVALMTDLLKTEVNHIILEIGTGSGYQTAILSLLVNKVYTMEIIEELDGEARERLKKYHYQNIETRNANGYEGWPEHAPYDGIIVTAAAPYIPDSLVDQLKPGGRLVIPVGQPYFHQELMVVEKDKDNVIKTTSILGVSFVPMVDRSTINGDKGESDKKVDKTSYI
jgi:protein-L-isoaspartate(D-aspartate) O-methyltransferase